MGKITDDHIRWILDMDAKGVQSELKTLSSQSQKYADDNKRMNAELKAAEKQMKEAEKTMEKLTKAGKEDSKAFNEAKKTYESAGDEITRYKQRISENTRAIEENNKKHSEIIRTMRIGDMTMGQLEQRAKSLAEQLKHTSQAASPDAYNQLSAELSVVENRMSELKNGSQSMFSVFKGGLAVFAGNMMTQSFGKVKQWINDAKEFVKEGINMANGAEGVVTAFNKLNSSKQHLAEMRKATRETISDLKLMEKTVRADELGIGIEKMGTLMQFAQVQAKKLKKDVDFMSDSIVDGIGRKSTLILDNLGISAIRIQNEVKKTGDFSAAVMNIVNEKLREQGNEALTGAEKAAQSATKWENAQLRIGQKAKWLGETWDTISGNIADGISKMVGETRTANEIFDAQLDRVAKLNVETKPLIDKYEELSKKVKLNYDQTKELTPEQEELLTVINQIKEAIPGVVTEFDKYGRAIGINTEKAKEFIQTQIAMLKYMNRDAINETQENIDDYSSRINLLKKNKEKGGYYTRVGGSNVSPGTEVWRTYSPEDLALIDDEISKYELLRTGAQERLKQINGQSLEDQVKTNEAMVRQQKVFNDMTKKQLDAWIKDEKNAKDQYLQMAKDTYKSRFGDIGGGTKDSKTDKELIKQKKDLAKMLEKLDTAHNKKLSEINQEYLDGKIETSADLNRKIHAQEQAYYSLREASLKSFKGKVTKTEVKDDIDKLIASQQNERLAKEVDFRQKLEKIIIDADPTKKEMESYKEKLSAYELYGKTAASLRLEIAAAETEEEKKALEQKLAAFLILEKEHQDNLDAIRRARKAKDKAEAEEAFDNDFKARKEEMQLELNNLMQQAASSSGSAAFEAEMAVHNQRLKMINEEVAARTKAGLDIQKLLVQQGREEAALTKTLQKEFVFRYKTYSQYTASLGNALGSVLSGQEDMLQAFGNSIVDIFFDIISKIIETKIMEATAVAVAEQAKAAAISAAQPDSVVTFGASAVARTAAIGAIIMGALQAAKATLKGLLGKKGGSDTSTSSNTTTTTNRRIVTPQQAQGKYDVIGEQDGKLYRNVPFAGAARTGVVSTPTLIAEEGPELVVSAPDFLALKKHINFPVIVQAIQDVRYGRVPQRASGKYNTVDDSDKPSMAGNGRNQSSDRFDEMIEILKEVRDKELDFNIYEFERKKKTADKARNLAKRK